MEELFGQVVRASSTLLLLSRRIGISNRAKMRLTCVRNRGELAEGWYDPATLQKAQQSEPAHHRRASMTSGIPRSPVKSTNISPRATMKQTIEEESESDDSVGPALPGQEWRSRRNRAGPSIPNMQDLELRRGVIYTPQLQPSIY